MIDESFTYRSQDTRAPLTLVHSSRWSLTFHFTDRLQHSLTMIMPHRAQLDERDFEEMLLDDEHMHSNSHERNHPYQAACGCRYGCSHCYTRGKTNGSTYNTQPATSPPVRGRSPTPKHDRTNGNGSKRPTKGRPTLGDSGDTPTDASSSVQGEEGLATHQLQQNTTVEIGDLGAHAQSSINLLLQRCQAPQYEYQFWSDSPDSSLLVEPSTAPSLASSGILLAPAAAGPDNLVVFAHGGFEELMCAPPRLWFGTEVGSSRNLNPPDSGDGNAGDRYPATLDMDMEE